MQACEAFKAVRESAEVIRNGDTKYFPEAASVGDNARQGDIYIELLEGVPKDAKPIEKPSAKLAPGDTQGSRHILDSMVGVTLYERRDASVLEGPIMNLTETRTVTHPEHGDWVLPPGTYGVTYQRAYAEDLRRQMD